MTLVSLAAIHAARATIGDRLLRTPVAESEWLSRESGLRVWLKLELFQRTGSFKPRGVLNAIHALSPGDRARGVISISAGNHAQALSWASSAIGIPSTIVMPATAVQAKVEATRAWGGTVVQTEGDLLATAQEIQRELGLAFLHPFDDPAVIAGTGTLGLELVEDLPSVNVVVVGCGGGGLLAGVAAAVRAVSPSTRVYGVEPRGADAMRQSLDRGEPVRLGRTQTVADGLAAPFAGAHTLAHVQAFVADVVLVDDDEILDAMRTLIRRGRILPEPAGAAATAALLARRIPLSPGDTVAVVVSGGNADPELLRSLL